MDSEISFGDVQHSDPERHIRPDQNKHYAVGECGPVAQVDLPMFVDLDVMIEMELHALSNTNVELGGVLLGGQFVDDDGQPFVVVKDSLRAEHYEATRGSFKFTHDTWREITRQREEFPDDLQMVGWYHTHPDWGVFLSGMDLFICNNFFNRPLDLALVIDPCRDKRGWFYWTQDPENPIEEAGGFYLFASRFREYEIEELIQVFQRKGDMASDPRISRTTAGGQSVVHLHDARGNSASLPMMAMLTVQFIVLALLFWQVFSNQSDKPVIEGKLAALQKELSVAIAEGSDSHRENIYREVLAQMARAPGEYDAVQDVVRLKQESSRLAANVDAQMALANQFRLTQRELESSLKESRRRSERRQERLQDSLKANEKLRAKLDPDNEEGNKTGWVTFLAYTLGAVALMLAGGIAGFFFRGRDEMRYEVDEDETVKDKPTIQFEVPDDELPSEE